MSLAALRNRIGDSLKYHTGRWWLSRAASRPFSCRPDRKLVTFTFDDFPRSALEQGGKILEANGVRGTFYASVGPMTGELGAAPAAALLDEVVESGHELGCHTYSHLDCVAARDAVVMADVERNGAALAKVVSPGALAHFAYPYGRVNRAVRDRLGRRFRTCRGIFPGINAGPTVDLALLRANKLYGGPRALARARRLIDQVARDGGWLIFFTHDVSDRPTPYGCTPREVERMVTLALDAGCGVATVGEALSELSREETRCPS